MAAPVTETFDSIALIGDGDADGTRNQGGSERTINGWEIKILDANGNPAFSDPLDTTGNSLSSYLDVTGNGADTDMASIGDNALLVNGYAGVAAAAQFSAATGEEFWLQSFAVQGYGMNPAATIVGYRNGIRVAFQDIVIDQNVSMITTTGNAWTNIDEFRIVQRDGSTDIAFSIDDIVVGPAVFSAAPVIGNLNGDSVSYWEGSSAVLIDAGGNATLTDADSTDFAGGSVRVSIVANRVSTEDELRVQHQGDGAGQIGVAGNVISYGGVQIGTLSGGTGSNDLVVTLSASATLAAVQALLRNLTYQNGNNTDPSTATRTIRVTVDDGDGGISVGADVTVAVASANDAPTLSATGTNPTFTENGSAVDLFSGVTISTVEAGQLIRQLTLTVGNVANGAQEILRIDGTDVALVNGVSGATAGSGWHYDVSVSGGVATLTLSHNGAGTAAVQSLLDSMSYRNESDAPDTTSRTVTITSIKDTGGTSNGGVDTTSTSITSTVSVAAVNDAPVAMTSAGAAAFVEGGNTPSAPVAVDSGLTISDVDSSTLSFATIRITGNHRAGQDILSFANTNAVSFGNITGSFNPATGELTLTSSGGTATLAQWQSALRSVSYTNTSDTPDTAARTVTFSASDGLNSSNLATKTITVAATNDTPVADAPASINLTEDVAGAITGLSFSDADAGSGSVTVTLTVPSGSLAATSGGGVTVGGSASALTLTGSLANINAFIAGSNISFLAAANFSGNVTLTATISDGAATANTTTTLVVAPVNDVPGIPVIPSLVVMEDVPTALTGISFSDIDAGNGQVQATFTVASGSLSATSGGDVVVTGSGTTLTLTGTIADINAYVASGRITFTTAANATADVQFQVRIDDQGNSGTGGNLFAISTATINVTTVNDAPVNTVPTGEIRVSPDSHVVFSTGNNNAISVHDVDAGSGTISVTLTATKGQLTLSGTNGLTFSGGDGTSDVTMTFSGTQSAINAALNGLTFTAQPGYRGAGTITITTNDLGLSGSGGSKIDTSTINLLVKSPFPAVESVGASSMNGSYKIGDTVLITVTFDEAVWVDGGTPRLRLETGLVDREAVYVSGSGGKTLTFSYRVQAGDLSADLDFASTVALSLNGSTLKGVGGADAVLTLPVPGSTGSIGSGHNIVIDGVAPTVSSVSVPANGTYEAGDNLDFTVNLSEAVTVVTSGGAPRIAITLGSSIVYAEYVSGNGTAALMFRLTVANGQLDRDGIAVGALDLNGGTIRDAAGNGLVLTLNSVGSTTGVLVDAATNTAPVLTGDLAAIVREGGSYTLTTADLNFTDPDDAAADVTFTVSALSNGKLLVDGVQASTFTGAELAAGKVTFVHDGSEATKVAFKVFVEDGNEDGSTPVARTFDFTVTPVNDAPVLTGDLKATVREGGSYTLTTADLNFTDPDDSAAGVRFTVSGAVAGKLLVNGTAVTSFTGAELAAGKVTFVHDGSETTKASFRVFIEDGNEDKSTPVAKTFNLAVTPVNDAAKLGARQVLTAIAEDASTASARKVADLSVVDPDGGSNKLSLVGSDSKLFEIKNGALWLKKGATLDFETNPTLDVTVRLDDPTIGTSHEAAKAFRVVVKDVNEVISGTPGNDTLSGTSANDVLDGKAGNDVIKGGAGNDTLIGGTGIDLLTGGAGRDTFVFATAKDSAPGYTGFVNNGGYSPLSGAAKRDIVTDFVRGEDRLDLSKIDADLKLAGDQAFVWRGTGDFSGKVGELIVRTFDVKGTANDRTIVYGDVDRDGRADFQIELAGILTLTKGDFLL